MTARILAITALLAIPSPGFGEDDPGRQVPFSLEFTLGGGGTADTFGTDISVGTNPIIPLPNIWVGVVQGVYWEPAFSGSTDIYADYSFRVWSDSLWLNLGWSAGVLYDSESIAWRTGPEASLQYYLTDEAFVYVGANYDISLTSGTDGGIRYGFGIGLQF